MTKASGSDIDVFRVGPFGYLSPSPVVNAEPGAVPFAVNFDAAGHLVIVDAGTNALSTYSLSPSGTLSSISTVATGQNATCWVATAQGAFFVSSAGSANVNRYAEQPSGQLALLGATGTDPGTVDAAPSVGGQYLYVQTGATRHAGRVPRRPRRLSLCHRLGAGAQRCGRRRHRGLLTVRLSDSAGAGVIGAG